MSAIRFAWFREFLVKDDRRRGFDDPRPRWARELLEAERYWEQPDLYVRMLLAAIADLAGWTAHAVPLDLESLEDVKNLQYMADQVETIAGSLGRLCDKRIATLTIQRDAGDAS